jgi:hypothetical protein
VLGPFDATSATRAARHRSGGGGTDQGGFSAGAVERALELTPGALADRIMVAGTPQDRLEWLTSTYAPAGLNHALLSFTDPFTLKAWARLEVAGLPGLVEQVRLFGEQVLPRFP